MGALSVVLFHVWTFGLLMFGLTTSFQEQQQIPSSEVYELSTTPKYSRFHEVESKCEPFLSSASVLEADDNRVYSIKTELAFFSGDWVQDSGQAPLMPFTDSPMFDGSKNVPSRLTSFYVTNVDPVYRSERAINVSGTLTLATTLMELTSQPNETPHFYLSPGLSELMILFEGIYMESNEGERVMCLLGNSSLPSRHPNSTNPWEWMKLLPENPNSFSVPLLSDDHVLLVLHYPKRFTLTTRGIRGEMKSLNGRSSLKYFDKVHIVSQLSSATKYQFESEGIVAKACNPYPYQDQLLDETIDVYKGHEFCAMLKQFTSGQIFDVVPNGSCHSHCSKLGPFEPESDIHNFHIVMQDLQCESKINGDGVSSARVSAVLRAIPPQVDFRGKQRSGLGGTTLSMEGVWDSSNGQLCMVGCLGVTNRCGSRICLYLALSFSLTQRSVLIGTISSIANSGVGSYFPLLFKKTVIPSELMSMSTDSHLSYKYSKIHLARAFLERDKNFDVIVNVKKLFFIYPNKENIDELVGLTTLYDDLTLHTNLPRAMHHTPYLSLEILSVSSLFGRYRLYRNESTKSEDHPLLNVSVYLSLTGHPNLNDSSLSLEGLYNPFDGKMYLIGCRAMDCLIQVKVEYPPKNSRWFVIPAVKVSITSQRNKDDPLYFHQILLETTPILNQNQRLDILSQRAIKSFLRLIALSVAAASILGHLFYIRATPNSVPYISIVMLGIQSLGYLIPLTTGVEALFEKRLFHTDHPLPYGFHENLGFYFTTYMSKLLVVATFLLTMKLIQKVWKSRIRLLTRTPLEPSRVPSDKHVLLVSLAIHITGFLIVVAVHAFGADEIRLVSDDNPKWGNRENKFRKWETVVDEYLGLAEDFFLLPQIIGNILWKLNCKPLRKAYYMGGTAVRFLPHLYNYFKGPEFNPFDPYHGMNEYVMPSSMLGDIALSITSVLFAIVVYVQQSFSYEKPDAKLKAVQVF
ncbi:hypothetical protein QJS10_CPA10g00465 [Acorus calamus]|uniref:RING-type E3 ubiquitin transferase n=1 Tax=Acorus calamus TaxID=4465 RepID=A0AAV9DXC2_ACOCL|nr:hypothetical protein QJS10_CPA10g00465 [Acorus calamus]